MAAESEPAAITLHLPRPTFFSSRLLQAIPISLIMVGSGLISSQIVIPFLEIRLETKSLVEPITAGGLNSQPPGEVLGGDVSTRMGEFFELSEIKLEPPPPPPEEPEVAPPPPFFYLSIPKLGIEKAKVESNSTSMKPDTALGHYLGTGLPGSKGRDRNNAFIYGHSALPQYFSPTNYKTIFAVLPKLEVGDDFWVYYNEKTLKYQIEAKQVLKPKDVNPLNPVSWLSPGESYTTLMTCVPPGGVSERLLIVGKLTKD